jgi:hypothetical protein
MKTCSRCKETRPLDAFWIERRRNKPKAVCKSCCVIIAREWRKNNPAAGRKRYVRDKVAVRERHLIRKYSISLAQYDAMLKAQDGKCAICRTPETEQFKGVFHVDHCHSTGKVRGLLCRGCNHILGTVKDNPKTLQRAIDYLIVPQAAAEVIGAYLDARP